MKNLATVTVSARVHLPSRGYGGDDVLGKLEVDILHDVSAAFQALNGDHFSTELSRAHIARVRAQLETMETHLKTIDVSYPVND